MTFVNFSRALLLAIFASLILMLSGCSKIKANTVATADINKTTANKPINKEQRWAQRQNALAKRSVWQLGSKVSFRIGDENLPFGLHWKQFSQANYEMNINNPITGALMSKLTRANNNVVLLADNGKSYRDRDEERLLKKQTNLNIPVKGMQHWVRGVSSPLYPLKHLTLDTMGRPISFEQAGWKVAYTRYANNEQNALPKIVKLSRGSEKIFIKLVAKVWK